MKKTFYIQTDNQNRITDLLEFAYSDYKPVELDTPIPSEILSGAYELIGDSPVYRKEWDRSIEMQRITDLENAIAELAFGGEMQ